MPANGPRRVGVFRGRGVVGWRRQRRPAGAAGGLHDVHDLVEDDGDEDDGADDDERPVGVEPPDAADAVGVGVVHLEHVDAVVDDPHDRRSR